MAPLELEGCNLGEKHKSYNELLKKVIKGETDINLNEFNEDDGDIENLLKIDIASYAKNEEYILKVLVCKDMLYVSKALKQCKWLLVENEYEHLINSQYLNTTLFPKMCTKAAIKLIKCLQFHLKDATRVEQFYLYEDNPEKAIYWLPHCSLGFIEENIVKHIQHVKPTMLKRLCEKSIKVLEIYVNNCPSSYMKTDALKTTIFLLRTDTQRYLDIVERMRDSQCPKFSAITTKILMKTCPSRIISNFEIYCNYIHLPSLVSVLKKENIKEFLLNQAKKAQENKIHLSPEKLKILVQEIPDKDKFEFIKKVFIDKDFKNETCTLPDIEKKALKYLYENICNVRFYKEHLWYRYAPFDIAFTNIKRLLEDVVTDGDKITMLTTLLICAGKNTSQINQVVQYIKISKKIRCQTYVKYEFLKQLFTQSNFKEFNTDMWNTLQDIVKGDNSNETIDNDDVFIWAIISYKVINKEKVPESILNNFKFNTLKVYQNKFNEADKQLIFKYLYEHITLKLQNQKSTSEEELKEWTIIVKHALNLLLDWDKDLKNFPALLNEIKKNIRNNINNCKVNLSFIYNMKKSWKKYFFDESLYLSRNDCTMINSLKHDPKLLERYSENQKHMALVEITPIRKFLRKIRVYYPTWLRKDWSVLYNMTLSNISEHQKVCFGISTLYSRVELKETLIEYAPKEAKLDDVDINELLLSLQRHFAKNMHFARPQPSPELLLLYTKGDYLKYALPSLLSIFYNLSTVETRKFITKLLDSPVSLQKFGIRLAFTRLPSSESSIIFNELWQSTKNFTIRCVLYKVVFELLCKEKNEDRVNTIWSLLSILIDGLTLEENNKIYDLLFEIEKLPVQIQALYYMKIFNFLKKLSHLKSDSENYFYKFNNSFVPYAITVLDNLLPEFVTQILLEYINEEFSETKQYPDWGCYVLAVMSSHLLNSVDDQSQLQKYNDIFIPFYTNCIEKQKYDKLCTLLNQLQKDIPKTVDKKRIIPLQMFKAIEGKLLESLSLVKHYNMLTKWKLTVSFVEILQTEQTANWVEMCLNVAPKFGKICSSILKEHCTQYFSYITVLFSKALKEFSDEFVEETVTLDIYLNMLDESAESHLVAIKLSNHLSSDENVISKLKNLKDIFSTHPSLEVKIHYYRTFNEYNDCFEEICAFND